MADSTTKSTEESTAPVFKKRSNNKNLRKRTVIQRRDSDSDGDESDEADNVSHVVTKERKTAPTPFVQSTRRKTGRQGHDEDESRLGVHYAADLSAKIQGSDATRYSTEWELEAEAMDKVRKAVASGTAASLSAKDIKPKQKEVTNSKMSVGPQRAPANIRVTARFDYQPDICKDYKETGFCGYGDSCIFLHDRGDYKSGWQIEKEWEEAQKGNKRFGGSEPGEFEIKDGDSDDDELPFACLICREEFVNPVVTKCGHYFCEECALKNYKKSLKCFACGLPTQGVFTTAKNLLAKLAEKKKRVEGEDVEDDQKDGETAIEGLTELSDSDEDSSD
ncbi:hypothetical protein J3Q64DRAFT_1767006 [Phycomyces blakesleeanus]